MLAPIHSILVVIPIVQAYIVLASLLTLCIRFQLEYLLLLPGVCLHCMHAMDVVAKGRKVAAHPFLHCSVLLHKRVDV